VKTEEQARAEGVPEWALRYDAAEYPHYAVTGDAVALALDWPGGEASLRALVVVRGGEPFRGLDAWPGGFLAWDEDPTTRETALRELREETGLVVRLTGLFGVYAGFDDPRVRAVLILYTAERTGGRLRPGDDAIEARYWPLRRPPRRIAFAAHRRALEELREAGVA